MTKSRACVSRGSPLLVTATCCCFLKAVQGSGAIRFGAIRLLVELEIQPLEDGQRAADNHNRIGRCVFRILCVF